MRVRLTLALDIDPEAWTTAYGVEGQLGIGQDVKDHLANLLDAMLREQGLGEVAP